MKIGLIGKKCGMTQIFTEEGLSIPVTVVEVLPNRITQVKTKEKDGYSAIQVTTGSCKQSRLNKPKAGHFAKVGVQAGRGLWEFTADESSKERFGLGTELTVDFFSPGQLIDIIGTTKGKGFAGVIKRHHFATQDATHGNSLSHRAPGSIGQRQSPGRVFKGKKMAGQLGNKRCTAPSLEIVKIDKDRNLLLVKGSVPGAPGNDLIITPAVRANS